MRFRPLPALVPLLLAAACASAPGPLPPEEVTPAPALPAPSEADALVQAAVEMVGTRYVYGGASPKGFDCSGLVVYAYARAGRDGVPHSAARLASMARPVRIADLTPGDLLFFDLGAKKASHVGIYIGDRRFVHAPSSGGRVEIVDFDHVYWSRHIQRAGRLFPASRHVAQAP